MVNELLDFETLFFNFIDCICFKMHRNYWKYLILKIPNGPWREVMIQMSFNFFRLITKQKFSKFTLNTSDIYYESKYLKCLMSIPFLCSTHFYLQYQDLWRKENPIKPNWPEIWFIPQCYSYYLKDREDQTLSVKIFHML